MADLREKQPCAVNSLESILQRDRLPNALLFIGNAGAGKQAAARLFAMALNCRERVETAQGETGKKTWGMDPCGVCRSCKKTDAGMHPDMITVAAEKNSIPISRIRELYTVIASPPHEASHRMVLVEDAPKMTVEAANALLKVLEEPPDRTFFILTADASTALLPTIVSRCRQVPFSAVPPAALIHTLEKECTLGKEQVAIAAATAEGNPESARRLLNMDKKSTTDWQCRREWLITGLSHLIKSGLSDIVATSYAMFLAERLTRDADTLTESLRLINTWLRDLMVIPHDPERVVNKDQLPLLLQLTQELPRENAPAWIKMLHTTETRIRANAAVRPALESFFLQLSFISIRRT